MGKMKIVYTEGFDDAYNIGEYMNTYDQEDNPTEWAAYEEGYNAGLNALMAETLPQNA